MLGDGVTWGPKAHLHGGHHRHCRLARHVLPYHPPWGWWGVHKEEQLLNPDCQHQKHADQGLLWKCDSLLLLAQAHQVPLQFCFYDEPFDIQVRWLLI